MAAAKTAYPFARRMDANVLSIGIWGTLKPKISPCCGGDISRRREHMSPNGLDAAALRFMPIRCAGASLPGIYLVS
jgi:hypothetical protein